MLVSVITCSLKVFLRFFVFILVTVVGIWVSFPSAVRFTVGGQRLIGKRVLISSRIRYLMYFSLVCGSCGAASFVRNP